MTWLIVIAVLLVLAFVLFRANSSRKQRRLEEAREAEKLEAKVGDHREMAADHESRAEELRVEAERVREEADKETTKADRHASRADELTPDSDERG